MPIFLEVDRETEDQKFFRKRIRAYIVFIKSKDYRNVAGLTPITIAYATTKGYKGVAQMRDWARQELASTSEPQWLSDLFLFTSLPENMGEIEPAQLFLDPVWYVPFDEDNQVSLLGE